jgi:hypothetical protein
VKVLEIQRNILPPSLKYVSPKHQDPPPNQQVITNQTVTTNLSRNVCSIKLLSTGMSGMEMFHLLGDISSIETIFVVSNK